MVNPKAFADLIKAAVEHDREMQTARQGDILGRELIYAESSPMPADRPLWAALSPAGDCQVIDLAAYRRREAERR